MLFPVWLQLDLFEHSRPPVDAPDMDDDERDRRSCSQWRRSISDYLIYRAGLNWRHESDRNNPVRQYYLNGLRALDNSLHLVPPRQQLRFTQKTIQDIRLGSLASWPVKRLVDELLVTDSTLTDRRLLSHLSKIKLAQMLMDRRAAHASEASVLERTS
ncbi:MAG: hypothetical protein WB424_14915 [Terracidiphilus sp.]